MSNDMLAAFLATLALWAGLRSRKLWQAILTGILMGLGLWAKVSVAALWPVVCLAMVGAGVGRRTTDDRRPTRNEKRETLCESLVAAVGSGAGCGRCGLARHCAWFLRNRQLYGDWMGWPLVLATIDRRTGPFGLVELAWLMRGLSWVSGASSAAQGTSRCRGRSTRCGPRWSARARWDGCGGRGSGQKERNQQISKSAIGMHSSLVTRHSSIRNRPLRRAADDIRLADYLQPGGARHRSGAAAVSGYRAAGIAAGRRAGAVVAPQWREQRRVGWQVGLASWADRRPGAVTGLWLPYAPPERRCGRGGRRIANGTGFGEQSNWSAIAGNPA